MRAGVSILVASLFFLLPTASYALNFDDLLRSYLGVAKPGSTQDISSGEQGLIKQNINTRQAQLESQIQAGIASGQLNTQEEADLRADLNRIAATNGSYLADGGYSRWEVQSILDQLNNFSIKLESYLNNATTRFVQNQPSGSSHPWGHRDWYRRHMNGRNDGVINNLAGFRADIDTKQAQIDAAITDGISTGRLSWSDSTALRAELNRIAQNEVQATSDGRMSYSEAQQLTSQLDLLNTSLSQKLAANNRPGRRRGHGAASYIGAQQSLLRQRINQGLTSGRLTRSEAKKLFDDEARISILTAKLRSNDGTISFDEQRRLYNQLDQLSRNINKELTDHQVQ